MEDPADDARAPGRVAYRSKEERWQEAPALKSLTPKQKEGAVVLRDLLVFQAKLLLDGLKDLVMIWISIGAADAGPDRPSGERGRRFYASMRAAEKFDRWLDLYSASEVAVDHEEGLFGASRAGADSLLGKIEMMVLGHEEPEAPPTDAPAGQPPDRLR